MMETAYLKKIDYVPCRTLRLLATSLTMISSPKLRHYVSRAAAYFESIFVKIFEIMPESAENEIGYIQPGGFPSITINGKEFPYTHLRGLTKASLDRSGLHYKNHWKYKFWHSPDTQFDMLRKANASVEGMMVEPVAIALDDKDIPAGYIMKRAMGRTLADLLDSRQLSCSASFKIEQNLAMRLEELHSRGIGHGDLNSENIFIKPNLEIVFIDPMETMTPKNAIELDHHWLGYIHSKLDEYRRKI